MCILPRAHDMCIASMSSSHPRTDSQPLCSHREIIPSFYMVPSVWVGFLSLVNWECCVTMMGERRHWEGKWCRAQTACRKVPSAWHIGRDDAAQQSSSTWGCSVYSETSFALRNCFCFFVCVLFFQDKLPWLLKPKTKGYSGSWRLQGEVRMRDSL